MPIRKFSKWILVVLCVPLWGCGSLLRVTTFNKDNPQGVPFFVKRGVCVQQWVYANPYWRMTYTYTPSGGQPVSETLIISEAAHGDLEFKALFNALRQPEANHVAVQKAWDDLKNAAPPFNPWADLSGQRLVSNSSSLKAEVDYHTAYAINQRKPFSGSSQTDFKLASDGTLSEASGQVQDNTFSTIVAALPISSLITSTAGIIPKGGTQAAEKQVPEKFDLKQEQRYIQIVYSQSTLATEGVCKVGGTFDKENSPAGKTVDELPVSVVISDVGSTNTPDTSAQSKNTDSISVSGTINLPKSLLPPAPAQNPGNPATAASAAQSATKDQPPSATPPKKK